MKAKNFFSPVIKSLSGQKLLICGIVMFIFILVSTGTPARAQTALVNADTISNHDTIVLCESSYSAATITTAIVNLEWQYTPSQSVVNSSITLSPTNNGEISMLVNGNLQKTFYFYIIPGPTQSTLTTANECGDIFSHRFDAGNHGILANYYWSNGSRTQWIDVTVGGPVSVTVSNKCGITSASAVVNVNHANDVNLGPDRTICLGDQVILMTNNTNIANYLWSDGSVTPTLTVSVAGSYACRTVDLLGCVSVDTMNLTVKTPYEGQEICVVTFDTITYHNIVIWPQHLELDSIIVQSSPSVGVWNVLGVVPTTQTTFINMTGNPQSNSEIIRIIGKDSCGNLSLPSLVHTTITLTTSYTPAIGGQPDVMGFIWSHYLIDGLPVATDYEVCAIDQYGLLHIIAVVSGALNQYNWENPNLTYVKFFIRFATSCGAKINFMVRSNYTLNPNGIKEELASQITFLANGTTITLSTSLNVLEITAFTSLGQKVAKVHNQMSLTLPSKGFYLIQVTTPKGIIIKKFII